MYKSACLIIVSLFILFGCGGGDDSSESHTNVINKKLYINMLSHDFFTVDFNHSLTSTNVYYKVTGDGIDLIKSVDLNAYNDGSGELFLNFEDYVPLPPGLYSRSLELELCNDQACESLSNRIPIDISYEIPFLKITPKQTEIILNSDELDDNYVALDLELVNDFESKYPDTYLYRKFSAEGNSLYQHDNYIEAIAGSDVGIGEHKSQVSLSFCFDFDCLKPVIQPPIAFSITHMVSEIPEVHIEPVTFFEQDMINPVFISSINSIGFASNYPVRNEGMDSSIFLYDIDTGNKHSLSFVNESVFPLDDPGWNKYYSLNFSVSLDHRKALVNFRRGFGIIEIEHGQFLTNNAYRIPIGMPEYGRGNLPPKIINNNIYYSGVEEYGDERSIKNVLKKVALLGNTPERSVLELGLQDVVFGERSPHMYIGGESAISLYDISTDTVNLITRKELDMDCRPFDVLEEQLILSTCNDIWAFKKGFKNRSLGLGYYIYDKASALFDSDKIVVTFNRKILATDTEMKIFSKSNHDFYKHYKIPRLNDEKLVPVLLFEDNSQNLMMLASIGDSTYTKNRYVLARVILNL
ncbi:hypothetical protein AKG98_1933 [Moritella sp. JT01]|uniref:hypothetical protein n=1 Tax=Moritella sp. JT01 TaxID=756698 RepID=UPI00079919D4|nr:hypothetical protein [Moritella sp. JT01]KXO08336.1 hypothetical protein AKG98_1933 [Moritella sp. JT01]